MIVQLVVLLTRRIVNLMLLLSRRIPIVVMLFDEDMATTVTPISPVVLPLGTVARAQIRQLNYQVLSFLGNVSSVHENMMLPNLDTFVLLAIEGHSTDKKVEHWSMVKYGDEGACEENKNGGSSGDFRTLKPP